MIEEQGIVRGHEGEFALVETRKQSICGGCATTVLCGTMTGDRPVLTVRAQDPIGTDIGENVTLGISERGFLKTAALLYMMPVVMLLSVGIIAQGFDLFPAFDKNVVAVVGGLIAMGLYLAGYRLWLNVRGDKALLVPVIMEAHGAEWPAPSQPASAWGKPVQPTTD